MIREYYRKRGLSATAEMLGRTPATTCWRAKRLGVQIRKHWSPEEFEQLKNLWSMGLSINRIARDMSRSTSAVESQLKKSKLSPVPDGFEYLSTASIRSGFGPGGGNTLRRILRMRGYTIRVVISRARGKHWRRHFVDRFEVDDAVSWWTQTETLKSAATREGICAETLKRWLANIGALSKRQKSGKHWRIHEDDTRRAMKARAAAKQEMVTV